MKDGVAFGIEAFRITAPSGEQEVRTHRTMITLTPVIDTGKEHRDECPCGCLRSSHREPDKLNHFEFEMVDKRIIRWDPKLKKLIKDPCAFEFWTKNITAEHTIDPDYPWIHWVFPGVSFSKSGRGRYHGTSFPREAFVPDDFLAGVDPDISNGAWWKSATSPPERR